MLPADFSFELAKVIIHSVICIMCTVNQNQGDTFLDIAFQFDGSWVILVTVLSGFEWSRDWLMTENHFFYERKTEHIKEQSLFFNCTLASRDVASLALTWKLWGWVFKEVGGNGVRQQA